MRERKGIDKTRSEKRGVRGLEVRCHSWGIYYTEGRTIDEDDEDTMVYKYSMTEYDSR
jgi:hypothetical protein